EVYMVAGRLDDALALALESIRARAGRGIIPDRPLARLPVRVPATHRPLPSRPRYARPARGQSAGGGAVRCDRDRDVPRDGHAALAGAGGGGDEGAGLAVAERLPLTYPSSARAPTASAACS